MVRSFAVKGGIKLAIVDDHPMFRQGVVAALGSDPAVGAIFEGNCVEDSLRICREHSPDVLLLDLYMEGGGHNAAQQISEQYPSVKIIVLTASDDDEDVSKALELGARGYVLKGVGGRELMETVLAVYRGETYVAPRLAAGLLAKMRRQLVKDISSDADKLTPREEEILTKVGEGLMNKEIAISLGIAEKTVKHYMTNILHKLQVRNRVEAVLALRSRSKG